MAKTCVVPAWWLNSPRVEVNAGAVTVMAMAATDLVAGAEAAVAAETRQDL